MFAQMCCKANQKQAPPNISISSGLSFKHIPVIIGKFVLAIHWIGEDYQISPLSAASS